MYLFYNTVKPVTTLGLFGMPYSDEQRKYCRVTMSYRIFRRGGDELTPGSPPGPSVVHLYNSQNLTPRSKNAGTDLVSEGQEVVVNPQPIHGNRKQLHEFLHELTFVSFPYGSGILKITLVDNL